MTQGNDIRPYGPGKFNTIVDSHVYDLSLNGGDDECGDVQVGYHYSLLRGAFKLDGSFVDFVPAVLNELTADERELLSTTAGVIIAEDSQGFVDVTYYDTTADLDAAWAECKKETAEYGGDDDAY
jgi:hypothetical protein